MPDEGGTDTKRGWVVVAAAFVVSFLSIGTVSCFGILLVALVHEFRQSRASTALVGSLMNGIARLVAPVAGSIYDTKGARHVVIAGSVLSSIGVFASYFAPSIPVLYVTFGIIGGAGLGLMFTPANTCVIKNFSKRKSLASGIAACGSGIGTLVMSQLMEYCIDKYGWRGAVLISSALLMNGVPFGLLLKDPENTETLVAISKEDSATHKDTKIELETSSSTWTIRLKKTFDLSLFKDYSFICFMLSTLFVYLAYIIPFSLLPDQVVEQDGMEAYEAAWLISSIGISGTLGRVACGWLGDRRFVNRFVLSESVIFLAGVCLAVSVVLTTFRTKLIFTCMYGLTTGGYATLLPVVLSDMFGKAIIGKSVGWSRFSMGIAGLISPPLGGRIFDQTGSYDITFLLAGSEFVLGGAFLLLPKLLNRHRQKFNLEIPSSVKSTGV